MTYNYSATPVRLTDECGDGTLMCPVCGGGNLHVKKVHDIAEGGAASGGGAQIVFSCELCSMDEMSLAGDVGSLCILHHKGTTQVSWELNPAFADPARIDEHDKLLSQYYEVRNKIYALKHPPTVLETPMSLLVNAWDK